MTGTEQPYEYVRIESEGRLRRLILDRAPLNVLTIEMLDEMYDALGVIQDDADVATVLVTGEGKAFCAGVDVADHTEDRIDRMLTSFHAVLLRMLAMEVPVVGALNGAALGGGMEVALACDVVLAREGVKIGQPEIQLGVFPPFAAAVLPRLVGRSRALDLCLTGRTLTADEAFRLDLVHHVFSKDTFANEAEAYATSLSSLSAPVLKLAKRAVVEGIGVPVEEALGAAESLYLNELMKLEDAHEGLAAFMEKRLPVWKGA